MMWSSENNILNSLFWIFFINAHNLTKYIFKFKKWKITFADELREVMGQLRKNKSNLEEMQWK